MRKYISLLLVFSILFCSSAFAALPETDEMQASNYFQSYGMVITAMGSGKLYLTFTCTAVGIADQLGVANFWVEKRDSDGNWEDITGQVNGSTNTNVTSYSFSKIFNGVAGETYRVKCTFMCTKTINGVVGTEHKSYTSGRKTAY